jgi:polar amino acid transport system substrate-binding protein
MNRRDLLIGAATGAVGAAGIATLSVAAQSAQAQTPATPPLTAGGTLDRIIKEKKIRITAEVTSPPFGILDKNNQPDGSEIATARQLAKDLGVELELVQVTSPQRIPALLAGRADVAISSLSITFDRAKTVMFASPHGALSIVIAGPKKTQIHAAADMAGKKIGLTRATLEEATVPGIAPQGTNIVFFDDIAATMQAMVSGQVDAAGMSAFAAKSVADRNPKAEIENKFTVRTAFYAPAIRPGDFDLLQFVNTWVFLNKQNGVLAAIYKKYTEVALVDLPVL